VIPQRTPLALAARLGPEGTSALEDVMEAREVQVTQMLQKEMQELRTELRVGMQELRTEMQALRADLRSNVFDSRAELKTLVADTRAEFRTMVADTRADLMKWALLFWVGQVAVVLALGRIIVAAIP
jgi:hypothetical protein